MNRKTHNSLIIGLFFLSCWLGGSCSLFAQQVSARISSREAWVGSPLTLQIQIANAQNYSMPETFEIDGCDVRSAGSPSQSSQITIINGRRSESRSVTMQYLITPRREGKFEIPELEIEVDGKTKTTQPIEFIATKSETGDLLFVEVEGKKEEVYVGEPLELNLKIWIRPFSDRDNRIKLDEGHMWQMISGQTSWGAFTERLQELAENRQRPGGETVLRKDADGREREYYLYEIEATVYPNKPGKIDASDLQIVVNYPQSLGRSRDPFDRFFEDSPFGRSSLMEEMMGGSPFGRRLSVSKSRPIVAETNVGSTEVLAVPVANRPADYRGAVGRYRIVSEAEPTNVSAGDPITLRIGIVGDGPMELVQAPPLHELENLTSDFQVTDQSLAGFVQDETKVFITTIRPRSESVTQIPAIPFSFFDPEKATYETVYTKPIDIDVEKAESLSLDAIVSDVGTGNSSDVDGASSTREGALASVLPSLDLRNQLSTDILQNETQSSRHWWWYFAFVPPGLFTIVLLSKLSMALPLVFTLMRSPRSTAERKIRNATDPKQLSHAICNFVASRTSSECPSHQHAVGKIREIGSYDAAAKLESLFERLNRKAIQVDDETSPKLLDDFRGESLSLLDSIEQVCKASRRQSLVPTRNKPRNSSRRSVTTSMSWLLWISFVAIGLATATPVYAADNSPSQNLETILAEANAAYQSAEQLLESDRAKSLQMFSTSAQKYQLLVDHGVRNCDLFINLGNAWHQSGNHAKAVLNYHRALGLNPNHAKARKNLRMIEMNQASKKSNATAATIDTESGFSVNQIGGLLAEFGTLVGWKVLSIAFAISSTVFWLLLTFKILRPKFAALKWCAVPLVFMLATGGAIYQHEQSDPNLAVVVAKSIELKTGDGVEFETEADLESTSGMVVNIIGNRADWCKIELADGQTGWLPESDLERVKPQTERHKTKELESFE